MRTPRLRAHWTRTCDPHSCVVAPEVPGDLDRRPIPLRGACRSLSLRLDQSGGRNAGRQCGRPRDRSPARPTKSIRSTRVAVRRAAGHAARERQRRPRRRPERVATGSAAVTGPNPASAGSVESAGAASTSHPSPAARKAGRRVQPTVGRAMRPATASAAGALRSDRYAAKRGKGARAPQPSRTMCRCRHPGAAAPAKTAQRHSREPTRPTSTVHGWRTSTRLRIDRVAPTARTDGRGSALGYPMAPPVFPTLATTFHRRAKPATWTREPVPPARDELVPRRTIEPREGDVCDGRSELTTALQRRNHSRHRRPTPTPRKHPHRHDPRLRPDPDTVASVQLARDHAGHQRPVLRQAAAADVVRRPAEHAVAFDDRRCRVGRQVDARVDHADLRRHRRRRRVREELRVRVHRLGRRALRRGRDLRARGGDDCRQSDGDQRTSSEHLRPQPRTVTRTCLDSPVLNGKPASARTRARNTYFAVPTVRVNL